MSNKKIIIRISNEIGNQLFMYASAFAIAKKLDRILIVDNETAYKSRKNISKYGLNNFKISSNIASKKYKFLGFAGYIKRKILKTFDKFKNNKKFFIEIKDEKKITKFNNEIFTYRFSETVYLEGYFESQKYFIDYENEIREEFKFIDSKKYINSPFYNEIIKDNSVAICIRQNRFIEGFGKSKKANNIEKSNNFTSEQVAYINKSIDYFKKKIENPIFYLWSNNYSNLDQNLFNEKINKVVHSDDFISNIDKRLLDLFLISQSKNHIVIPSSFNWWGAWLSNKKNKIILRPSDSFFSEFALNNKDFWPSDWVVINE